MNSSAPGRAVDRLAGEDGASISSAEGSFFAERSCLRCEANPSRGGVRHFFSFLAEKSLFFTRMGVEIPRLALDKDGGRPPVVFDVDSMVDDGCIVGISSLGETSSYEEEMVGANANSLGLDKKMSSCFLDTRGGVCMAILLKVT